MKSNSFRWTIALSLFAALAIPVQISAQHTRYKLIDLGTFGGPNSTVFIADDNYDAVLNNRGTVSGSADTSAPDPFPNFPFSDGFVSHAFQWQNGVMNDLGALPGGGSSASAWVSTNGLIAGWSENGLVDPGVFPGLGFPESHAVLWKHGEIQDLGTLEVEGGHESVALAVNSGGQVVGAADNDTNDLAAMGASNFGWTTQTRGFLWQDGAMQDLGTLGGPDAVALLVNERGQIVGDSYTSSLSSAYCANIGFPLATGAFLWESGKMKNLGSFGGTCTFAFDLNNRGQVVGASTLAGDLAQHPFLWERGVLKDLRTFGGGHGTAIAINDAGDIVGWAQLKGDQAAHAFLWKNGAKTDLGTVAGDSCSFGFALNSNGQVVGVSATTCPFEAIKAFLWDGISMIDLNTLIPPDSPLYLTIPETINDRGEIAGVGLDSNGNQHAFLLIPCGADDTACQDLGQEVNVTQSMAAPIASPTTTTIQPSLRTRGMATVSRARLARGYRIPVIAAPSPPHNQTASALNTYQIKLNWQEASGQNQSGFNIYRCHGCSSPRSQGTKIASVGASVFTYPDGSSSNPLTENTTYTYQVTAFNGGGESGPSNAASAATMTEPTPTNLTSFAFRRGFDDIVKLSWTNNSSDDDSFHIERCAGATCTNFSEIAQTGANATTYSDYFQFANGRTFRYRVRAHSPGGFSGYSNIRTQTLP